MSFHSNGRTGTNTRHQSLLLTPEDVSLNSKKQRRPPRDVVVIRATPDSMRREEQDELRSPFELQCTDSRGTGDAQQSTSEGSFVSTKLTELSPFKLRPRNPMLATCTPSPASRKRRANSMSAPEVACAEITKGSPPRYPSDVSNYSSSNGDSEATDRFFKYEQRPSKSIISPHGISPLTHSLPSTIEEPDSLNLKELCLQSPIAHRPVVQAFDPSPTKNQQYGGHSRVGSSFTAFSESPGRSLHKTETPGSLSTSSTNNPNQRTPCSSAKSSPRQVPLTVISNGQGACSPLNPPPPPYHPLAETTSAWLYSVNDDDESDSDVGSPKRLSIAKTTRPSHLTPQNMTAMLPGHECGMNSGQHFKTSPLLQRNDNDNKYSAALPSPKTPLPKIVLAPRTPLSETSRVSSSAHMSMYQYSPGAGPEMELLGSTAFSSRVDNEYSTSERLSRTDQQIGDLNSLSRPSAPSISHFWQRESNNSLALSVDGSKDGNTSTSGLQNSNSFGCLILEEETRKATEKGRGNQATRPSFLPSNDDWHNPVPSSTHTISHHSQSCFGSPDVELTGTPQRKNKKFSGTPQTASAASESKSQSLFTLPKSDNMLAILQGNGQSESLDLDQGSLTDSDDGFILAKPGDIAEEKLDATSKILEYHDRHKDGRGSRRVKQRCHSSLNTKPSSLHVNICSSGESLCLNMSSSESNEDVRCSSSSSSTLDSVLPKRSSSASLNYQSASNTSLFGMDIVHEEECSECAPHNRTVGGGPPFCGSILHKATRSHSGNALRRTDSGAFGSSCSLSRKRSDQSLGSLGLTLEGSLSYGEDSNRDLVTPPVVRASVKSPPPLAPAISQKVFGFKLKSANEAS